MKKVISIFLLSVVTLLAFTSCEKNDLAYDFPYQYDLTKYIDISKEDYIGIDYSDYSVGDEDIYSEIQKLLEEHAIYTDITDRAAQTGDFVNVDYKGYIDGVEFDNGSAEGDELILGSSGYITGFEEGIAGHNVGETFTVEATFPEDFGVDTLNGKTAQFEVTLNKVQSISYPSLTDSFISENTEFNTFNEYYQNVKQELEEKAASSAVVQQKNEAFEKICSNVSIIDYPNDEYQSYYNSVLMQYATLATQNNQTLEQYVTEQGASMDDFYAYIEEYVKSSIATELVYFAIAKNENILSALTQSDYDAYLKDVATEYLSTPEKFEEMYGEEAVWKSLVWDKVMDFVLENGQVVSNDENTGTDDTLDNDSEQSDDADTNNSEN